MDLESTYSQWLGDRVAQALVDAGCISPDQRNMVAAELARLQDRERWGFRPPELVGVGSGQPELES